MTARIEIGAICVLVAVLASSCSTAHDTAPSVRTSCVATVRSGGHDYATVPVAVAPLPGDVVGSGVLAPCNDTGGGEAAATDRIVLAAIAGVPPSVAVGWKGRDDLVLVRDDADTTALPAALTQLRQAPDCVASDEPVELSGELLGILGPDGKTEADLEPPYDLYLRISATSSPRYDRAALKVRVGDELGRPLSRAQLESLFDAGSLELTASCDGRAFRADALQVRASRR